MASRSFPAEVPLSDLSGDQLRARVARAEMYLIYSHASPGSTHMPSQFLEQRHAYLRQLEVEGRLFAFGPLEPVTGAASGELSIIAAASREEAERIAAADPFCRVGYRVNEVQAHTMNEGVACYVGRALAQLARDRGDTFSPLQDDQGTAHDGAATPTIDTQVYLISLEPTDKPRPATDIETMDSHFVWLRENEMSARLMSCGPVEPTRQLVPGAWGGGLGVVATTREEAERIAAAEPSGHAGYRVLSVRGWVIQCGLAAPIASALHALNRLSR